MGTIRIEQYGAVGSDANRDSPVCDLKALLVTTVDATTSTTAETLVLNKDTKIVVVHGTEAHRVVIASSDVTASLYSFVPGDSFRNYGVPQGATLYYRLDA